MHLLLEELLLNIFGWATRDLDPGLREQSTGHEDKGYIEDRMEGIREGVSELPGWWDIVGQTSNWYRLAIHLKLLPVTKKVDKEVSSELLGEHLREEEQIGDQCRLQDDWDVGGIEELDWVSGWLMTSDSLILNINVHLESLEENDHQEDEDSREYVIDIGESSSLEGVLKSIHLIGSLH